MYEPTLSRRFSCSGICAMSAIGVGMTACGQTWGAESGIRTRTLVDDSGAVFARKPKTVFRGAMSLAAMIAALSSCALDPGPSPMLAGSIACLRWSTGYCDIGANNALRSMSVVMAEELLYCEGCVAARAGTRWFWTNFG